MTDTFNGAAIGLDKRRRKESTFQWMGRIAIIIALTFLVGMVGSIFWTGKSVLQQAEIALDVNLGPDVIDPADIDGASFSTIVKDALKAQFPDVTGRSERRELYGLVSPNASFELKEAVQAIRQSWGAFTKSGSPRQMRLIL